MVDDPLAPGAANQRPSFPVRLSPQSKAGLRSILNDPSALTVDEDAPEDPKVAVAPTGDFGTPLAVEEEAKATAAIAAAKPDRGPTGDGVRYTMEPWDTPEVRADIERRCSHLDYSDLALTGRITQIVPIIPGALEVTFCTACPAESIYVQRRTKNDSYADFYTAKIEDLAIAFRRGHGFLLTGKQDNQELSLPDPLVFEKNAFTWDENVYLANLNRVQYGLPQPVVARLLVNLWWFEVRVRNAMLPESLGNFSGPT